MKGTAKTDFFDPAFAFAEVQAEQPVRGARTGGVIGVVATAALAAAISAFSISALAAEVDASDLVISQSAIQASTSMSDERPAAPVPSVELLYGLALGRKAEAKARRVLESADDLGVRPDRVAALPDGSAAIYWLSSQKTPGGGSVRLAMFESAKDGLTLVLSDRVGGATEASEVKPVDVRSSVERAVAYIA